MNIMWLSLWWCQAAHALDTQRTREDGYVVVSAVMPHSVESVNPILQLKDRPFFLRNSIRVHTAQECPLDCRAGRRKAPVTNTGKLTFLRGQDRFELIENGTKQRTYLVFTWCSITHTG